MKSTQRHKYLAHVLLVGLCVFGVMGCSRSASEETADVDQIRIVAKRSGNAVELNAGAIFAIMTRCGFTDQQVYFQGTALRDALKNHGGACIFVGEDNAEVLLRVQGEIIQGISKTYGYFEYDVKADYFKLGASPQSQSFNQGQAPAPR